MKTKTTPTERDRETTERRLLDTIGQMITESGFEKIGINGGCQSIRCIQNINIPLFRFGRRAYGCLYPATRFLDKLSTGTP